VEIEIVVAGTVTDRELESFVRAAWGSDAVVAHGERLFPARLPGFVALTEGQIVGHASYRIVGDACELTSIVADPRGAGIGSRLMDEVIGASRMSGCRTIWLTTTNDNLDALRFYQRRGFRLIALRAGAVDKARRDLKPELPETGADGIPMRDELDLEMTL
jgi:ribosomal protein S18 acetylase RimI-like enzyme